MTLQLSLLRRLSLRCTKLGLISLPRFGEFCCCFTTFLPDHACNILTTWEWQFSCTTARARTCFAVPLAARQVDQVQLALLERGVARLAVRVDALHL